MNRYALALFLAVGCAHLLPGNGEHCPASGGPQWRELRSQHFILDTDLDAADARKWVQKLETYQAMELVALTGEARKVPNTLRVLVTKDDSLFYGFVGKSGVLGYFKNDGHLLDQLIVFSEPTTHEDPETVAHEVAHFLSFQLFPNHPAWFEEGLVHFVATVANEKGEYAHSAGLVPHDYGYALNYADRVFAKTLLREHYVTSGLDEFWAWLLFHYLWNTQPKQFEAYQNYLVDGDSAPRAWKKAFPQWDPDVPGALEKLDDALLAHKQGGQFEYYKIEIQMPEVKYTERLLSAAEVHVRMAEAAGFERDVPDQIKKALEDDKALPEAVGWQLEIDKRATSPNSLPLLTSAQASHPDDWRGAYYVGMAQKGAQRIAMLQLAVKLEPQAAIAQRELARALLEAKQFEEAVPHAKQAVMLVPEDDDSCELLASVAIKLGDCDAASLMILRGLDLLPPEGKTPDERHDAVRARLQQDVQACTKK